MEQGHPRLVDLDQRRSAIQSLLNSAKQIEQDWHGYAVVEREEMLHLEHREPAIRQVVLSRIQQLAVVSCHRVRTQRGQQVGVLELGHQLSQSPVRARTASQQSE